MSDYNVNNTFHVSGDNNVISVHQEFVGKENEAMAMILKFLITLLLAPITVPIVLAANGYRALMDRDQ